MNKKPTRWFTRQDDVIQGPFTDAMIKNNIALNRLDPNSVEVSSDQVTWTLLKKHTNFHPLPEPDPSSLRHDERDGFDRRQPVSAEVHVPKRRDGERREIEAEHIIKKRQLRTLLMQQFRNNKQAVFLPILTMVIVVIALSILTLRYSTPLPISQINCNQSPGPKVNWTNCIKPQLDLHNTDLSNSKLRNSQLSGSNFMNTIMTGTDLAYSDLSFTDLSYSQLNNCSLVGANLQNANLSYSDLSNSDLSYADLRDANMGESKFNTTRFDHAIWVDGQKCLAESIGRCITSSN